MNRDFFKVAPLSRDKKKNAKETLLFFYRKLFHVLTFMIFLS